MRTYQVGRIANINQRHPNIRHPHGVKYAVRTQTVYEQEGLGHCGSGDCGCGGQGGEGFLDSLKSLGSKAGELFDKANNSRVGTALKNFGQEALSDSKYKRPGFPGEKHPIITDYDGKKVIANYLGPGTQYSKRIARGDPPVSVLDEYAKKHDGQYEKGRGDPAAIRRADLQFIANVTTDNRLSKSDKALGIGAIGTKVALEKAGVKAYPEFAGEGNIDNNYLPGEKLRKKMIKTYKRQNGKGKKKSHHKRRTQHGNGILSSLVASVAIPALVKKIKG